ncbi:hypothetical protein [Amycolatopsis sp. cmx-4-61]|uniref:hypothetical protein n=1 Tax=Amycolatopsis sp. cmx-4-61 TaxID=2790937 RepID=UPI00397D3031
MRKLSATVAAGAALFAGVVTPVAAGATTASPQTVLAGGRCTGYGVVRTTTSVVAVHTGAGPGYRVVKLLSRGSHVSCRPLTVGHPDAPCGPSCRPPSPRRNA